MKNFELEIVKALSESGRSVQASPELRERINLQLDYQIEREKEQEKKEMEDKVMRGHFNIKKIAAATVVACLIISMGCLAAGKIAGYESSTNRLKAYHSYADMDKVYKKAGYQIKAVESFQNGYTFEEANVSEEKATDEAGNAVATGNGITIEYKLADKSISLYADTIMQMEEGTYVPKAEKEVNGVKLIYLQSTNKFVPADYELTEEDKENEKNPDYNIAYGSSEIQIQQSANVIWEEDGVKYDLLAFDTSLTPDEMFEMAAEIIKK